MITMLKINHAVKIKLPASEVCMFMGLAGRECEVVPLSNGMAQLMVSGAPYSFPITWGEAGIYRDHEGNPYMID